MYASQGCNLWLPTVTHLKTPACWLTGFFKEKRFSPVRTRACFPDATCCSQVPVSTNRNSTGSQDVQTSKRTGLTQSQLGRQQLWTQIFLSSPSQISSKWSSSRPGLSSERLSLIFENTQMCSLVKPGSQTFTSALYCAEGHGFKSQHCPALAL